MTRKIISLGLLGVALTGGPLLAKGFDWPAKDGFERKDLEKFREIERKFKASQEKSGKDKE